MIAGSLERVIGWAPRCPAAIDLGAAYKMHEWFASYERELFEVFTSEGDGAFIKLTEGMYDRVRDAHARLQMCIRQNGGSWQPAVDILMDVVEVDLDVVLSHPLNTSLWGEERAGEIEDDARRRATEVLRMLSQVDPEWARQRESLLLK